MRTARAMGIGTVAVFSDADAGAPHLDLADAAVHLPGNAPGDTYLRGDLLIDAALRTGADAVHPGYGFLSENAGFARACADAGLTFVGPPPAAIEAMGSKLAAKALMARAGVPVLGSETVDGSGREELLGAARRLGFPVLVKAAFGGGGRGMRVVREPAELEDAVGGARREAASAFGDGTVFLEPWVEAPRHVEVQILGDEHGNAVHLFERECSIQRRHQKIVEESPSTAVDGELRERIGEAAVTAARAIGYVGAGTVEFLLAADGGFHFLEVNTRLQVEHPVTEMITGLDLVRLQLLVAQGAPLPADVLEARISGHAIEARLYAEDVAAGFLPVSGRLHRFRIPAGEGVRVDSGYADGSVVSVHYDAMLAKVIAWAPSRAEAAQRLAAALAAAELHGVTTNRDLLVAILREPEFLAGRTDTGYLDRHDPAVLGAPPGEAALRLHAAAAALAGRAARRAAAPVLRTLPSGWRNNPSALQHVEYECGERRLRVEYGAGDAPEVTVDGEPLGGVRVRAVSAESADLQVDGVRRRVRVHAAGTDVHVDSALGSTLLREVERLPDPGEAVRAGSLRAPMPGSVVRVLVEAGDNVSAGQPLVVLEAMKMEHTVQAPQDGRVREVNVAVGVQVESGAVLAVVDPPS
ncbi:MAG TPA: biotin carboxylase N-terminal domain-containing protein [Candidatus Dormibacteraeota bacterium]|nr:biotin carboxylase N-terminal domain-containing protein [Candidatus Dormibacteraeota bacterium]